MNKEIEKLIDAVVDKAVSSLNEEALEGLIDRLIDKVDGPEKPDHGYIIISNSEGDTVYFRHTCGHVPGHKGEKMPVFSECVEDAWVFETKKDAQECLEWLKKEYPELEVSIDTLEEDPDEGFDFSVVIPMLKCGKKLTRKGWNGKDQYIQLSTQSTYQDYDGPHKLAGKVIVFHGTLGVQVGWLASQGDLLAEDWVVVR